jgi:hypothetical protein
MYVDLNRSALNSSFGPFPYIPRSEHAVMKIFGREPALIISAVGTLVTLLVALNVPGLSAGAGAAITTFASAAIIAVTTRPVAPALFTAVVAAGAALFAEYGLNLSDGVVAAVSSVVLVGFALFGIRPQVTPTADPHPTAVV